MSFITLFVVYSLSIFLTLTDVVGDITDDNIVVVEDRRWMHLMSMVKLVCRRFRDWESNVCGLACQADSALDPKFKAMYIMVIAMDRGWNLVEVASDAKCVIDTLKWNCPPPDWTVQSMFYHVLFCSKVCFYFFFLLLLDWIMFLRTDRQSSLESIL